MRLLITRPEPDNERTARALRARGHEVLLAPLLRIEFAAAPDLGSPPWVAVLLSSANGARAAAEHPRRGELLALPALVVGRGSAEAARAAGFADVISADGDASDLSRLAAERFAGARSPLLYLAGEDRSGNLAGALSAKGLIVHTVAAYRAAKVEKFPAAAFAALERGHIDGVLHFSRRSVESYVECGRDIPEPALAPVHYCLSARAAGPLRHAGAARIRVAAQPDEANLLALVTPHVTPHVAPHVMPKP
jgi:uroporphyrinogen-III synthase